MTLRIGLSAYDMAAADFVQLAVAADEVGFDSIWLGEHVVLPLGYGSEHPTSGGVAHQHHTRPIIDPSTKLIDPLVALGAAAAATTRIKLATGIFILPLRHPLITARMTATVHDIAGGRFVFGVGSGWLREEFDAVSVPFEPRGALFDESIDVLRAAWSGKPFAYDGAHYSFGDVQVCPEPAGVPLVLGGSTDRALRRAALKADGWFASGTPAIEDAVRNRDRVMALRAEYGRFGDFSIHVRVAGSDPAQLLRYEAEGLENVVVWADQVWPTGADLETKRAAIAAAAQRLGVQG